MANLWPQHPPRTASPPQQAMTEAVWISESSRLPQAEKQMNQEETEATSGPTSSRDKAAGKGSAALKARGVSMRPGKEHGDAISLPFIG